jgi:osmotically-inducible protein OsmY
MYKTLVLLFGIAFLVACSNEQNATVDETVEAVDADNTARNATDTAAQTSGDQSESEADIQISANIRKAIVADESLSTNAHNVKVITSGGTVTLRGPVKSEQEKAAVEAKAKQAAGVIQVVNLLEIEVSK